MSRPVIIVEESSPLAGPSQPVFSEVDTVAGEGTADDSITEWPSLDGDDDLGERAMTPVDQMIENACQGTMTSPQTPVVEFMALANASSPSTLLHQIESVTISNELLREHSKKLAQGLADRDQQIHVLENNLEQQGELLHQLKADLTTANTERMDDAELHRQAIDELNNKAEHDLASLAQTSEDSLASMRGQLVDKDELVESLRMSVEDLQVNSRADVEYTQQIEMLQSELDNVQRLADESGVSSAGQCAKLEKQIEQSRTVTRNLQNDMRMLYNKNKAAVSELEKQYKHEDYKSRYQAIVLENNVLVERMAQFRGCSESVAATTKSLEQAELRLNETLEGFQTQRSGMLEELTLARRAASDLQERCAQLEVANSALEAAFAGLGNEKAAAMEECDSLQAFNASLSEQRDNFEMQLAEKDVAYELLENSIGQIQLHYDRTAQMLGKIMRLSVVQEETIKTLAISDVKLPEMQQLAKDLGHQLQLKTVQYEELNVFMEDERCVRAAMTDELNEKLHNAQEQISLLQEASQASAAKLSEQLRQGAESRSSIGAEIDACRQAAMKELAAEKQRAQTHLETLQTTHEQDLEDVYQEISKQSNIVERLSGQLCEKELALLEADGAVEQAQIEAKKVATQHSLKLEGQFDAYRRASEAKIQTLRDNLHKAEAEVEMLDKELQQMQNN